MSVGAQTDAETVPTAKPTAPEGGRFLLETVGEAPIFTPEQLSDEQRMMYKTGADFVAGEVVTRVEEIEAKKPGLLRELLDKAGELGLLMVKIPEAYGGLGANVTTGLVVTEAMARIGSWSVTIGAHNGIGTEPILFFGNDEQKARYLPKLATGEKIAAYALTEPGAGSDALAGRTKAELTEDGKHYKLNGDKQWITNGGFADVFVVFAKIDGEKFTGFIVEKDTPGFSVGAEEHKMGIRGSSTTTLHFEDALVPVENVLGEIGKGHKIAFGILNMGRLKLGVGSAAGAKHLLADAVTYGLERKTFGRSILEYGILRQKIARMAALIYASESMAWRTSGLIDDYVTAKKDALGKEAAERQALEAFAVESSIMKVFGTEALFYVADEDVQIHGGYGFVEDYEIERAYRDQRVYRIFEGTNEINRLLVPGMLLKRAMKGELDLFGAAQKIVAEVGEGKALPTFEGPLSRERTAAEAMKRMALFVLSAAAMKHGPALEGEQEILAAVADLIMAAFAADSTVARTLQHSGDKGPVREALTAYYVEEAWEASFTAARRAVSSLADGAERDGLLAGLSSLYAYAPVDFKATQETIVGAVIEAEAYPFPLT
jgi:alkylation response protein AidB-like acyl-CoA dehydrogenase